MSAASSGDPGGSRWPDLRSPSSAEFGALTYLLLTCKDEKIPLPDPFIVGKSVENAADGPIEGASTEAQGTRYTLKIRNPAQIEKLLKLSKLIDNTEVVVQLHPNLNISRCVVSCFEAIRMEEKDILQGLTSQGVIRVQRITIREQGQSVNTPALILTFAKCNYPVHVKIGVLRVTTRPYYPNPLLCYSCGRYGHPRARCPGPQRCLNCSNEHEVSDGAECVADAHCINCGGAHRSNNRQCPVYKKEMQITRMKVDMNLTYPEARKRVETGLGSYATAVAQKTADRKKLEEIEKKMLEKDSQISQLLTAIKQKDEKIDKLLAHIKMTEAKYSQQKQQSTPISPPSAPIQRSHSASRKPAGDPQMPELSIQPRTKPIATTNSQDSNSNKKKKRLTRSNNSSPGRQSPPLKKPADKEQPSDQDAINIDEDSQIEEMPPSQHLR